MYSYDFAFQSKQNCSTPYARVSFCTPNITPTVTYLVANHIVQSFATKIPPIDFDSRVMAHQFVCHLFSSFLAHTCHHFFLFTRSCSRNNFIFFKQDTEHFDFRTKSKIIFHADYDGADLTNVFPSQKYPILDVPRSRFYDNLKFG